jgi:hypothetical protein
MSTVESTSPSNRGAGERIPVNRFALFAETILVGVLVLVLSLPLVTIPAAYAAGIAHLERHLHGRDDSVRALWGTFRAALPGSWTLGTTTAAATAVVILNLLLATVGQLPGRVVVLPATLLLAAAGLVLLLRTTAAWSDGAGSDSAEAEPSGAGRSVWREALETGKALSARDFTGSLLLVAATFMAVVFVWMLAALFLVVPGALVLAAAAVKMRAARQ